VREKARVSLADGSLPVLILGDCGLMIHRAMTRALEHEGIVVVGGDVQGDVAPKLTAVHIRSVEEWMQLFKVSVPDGPLFVLTPASAEPLAQAIASTMADLFVHIEVMVTDDGSLGRARNEVQSTLAQVCDELPPHLVVELITAEHTPISGWIEAPVVCLVTSDHVRVHDRLRACEQVAALEESVAVRLRTAGIACCAVPADGLIPHLVAAGEAHTCGKLLREGARAFTNGDVNTAVERFEEAVGLAPEDARALNALGVARFAVGDHREAEHLLAGALAADPSYLIAAENLDALRQSR
jgi:hypothetical protein